MSEQKPQVEVCQDGMVRIRDRADRDRIIIMHDPTSGQPMVLICRPDGRVAASVGFATNDDTPTVLVHDANQQIKAGFQFGEDGQITVAAFDNVGLVHMETTESVDVPVPRQNIFDVNLN